MSTTLAIFALSGALKEEQTKAYQSSLELFKKEGFSLELASNLESRSEIFADADYFCAGSQEERILAFEKLIKAEAEIFLSLKGGYGAQHCLTDIEEMDLQGKSFFGYSDLTALLISVYNKYLNEARLFHSPMLTEYAELSEDERKSLLFFMKNHKDLDLKKNLLELTPGLEEKLEKANSILLKEPVFIWGGNLSLLLSENFVLAGAKNILFLEDCYEDAYKVERLFISAFNQGFFDDIDELWLGEAKETKYNYSFLQELADECGFNLVRDLPFGHKTKFTLPIFQQYN